MKKHFLLLMLMALLPFAGWADDFNVTVKPMNIELEYGTSDPTTITTDMFTFTSNSGSMTAAEVVSYLEITRIEGSEGNAVGSYDYRFTTKGLVSGQVIKVDGNGKINIKPKTITLVGKEASDQTGAAYGDGKEYTFTVADFSDKLVGTDKMSDFDLQVSLAEGAYVDGKLQANTTGWAIVATVGTSANTEVTKNYTITSPSETFIVAKADITVSDFKAPTAKTLTYNGENQALVNAGETSVGTFNYIQAASAPEADATEWSEDIPQKKDYAAAGYPVYYKIAGDANHNDYYDKNTAKPVAAAINQKVLVAQAASLETYYSGAAPDVSGQTIGYTGFVTGEDDEVITYGSEEAPIAKLVDASKFDAGTYDEGIDVDLRGATAKNYNIVTMPSKLVINKAKVKVILKTAPAAAAYNSEAAKVTEWTVAKTAVEAFKQTGVNEGNPTYSSTSDVNTLKGNEEDNSLLASAKISRDDKATTPGSYALTLSGVEPVNSNYEIAEQTVPAGLVFTINGSAITVKATNKSKVYGEKDPNFTVTITGSLTEAQKTELTEKISMTRTSGDNVGIYDITFDASCPEKFDGNTITYNPGVFVINKAPLEVNIPAQRIEVNSELTIDNLKGEAITVTGNVESLDADVNELYTVAFNSDVDLTKDATDEDGIIVTVTSNNYYVANETNNVSEVTKTGLLIIGAGSTVASLELDDSQALNYATITANNGNTITNLTVKINRNRTLGGKEHKWAKYIWQTMVLPFDVTVAEISAETGYAIVNVLNPEATKKDTVAFKLEMNNIPANTPFVLKTADNIDGDKTLKFKDKQIVDGGENPSVSASTKYGYKFVGVYTTKTCNAEHPEYSFRLGDKDTNEWSRFSAESKNTWDVLPFDAYIDYGTEEAARNITYIFEEIDGTTTAIRSISDDNVNSVNRSVEGWYNLNGVKIAEPTQKGIYIHNGKKVVIK